MKRKNTDLLLKSFEAMFDCQNENDAVHDWRDKFRDLIWHLSVAGKDELAEVYDAVVEDSRFWEMAVEVHAIVGRIYAASLAASDHKKAVEVSERLVSLYCSRVEWEDFKDGIVLQVVPDQDPTQGVGHEVNFLGSRTMADPHAFWNVGCRRMQLTDRKTSTFSSKT